MIYWISGSITTSMRLYSEAFSLANLGLKIDAVPTDVPTAVVNFPNELVFTPRFIGADKFKKIVHFSHAPRGDGDCVSMGLIRAALTTGAVLSLAVCGTTPRNPPSAHLPHSTGPRPSPADKPPSCFKISADRRPAAGTCATSLPAPCQRSRRPWRRQLPLRFNSRYLQQVGELLGGTKYKWAEREASSTRWPQFKTQVAAAAAASFHAKPKPSAGGARCFGLSHDCVLSQHDDVANQADTRWILSNKVHERRRRQEGVALRDSPAGLAAYILEKFSTWTEKDWRSLPDGGLTKKFTLTKLLDNVMIYWISGSITTSMRLYSEFFSSKNMALQLDSVPTDVPTAFANFPNEIGFTPEFIAADKYERIVHFSHPPRGGHFPALEEPRLLADDIWDAFPKLLRAAADRAQHKAK
ncbi:Epoxide hydrolase [Gryllus bimaculatus]|nr:Epoxide hydrolase [Gryllus bimaculatus]